VDALTSGRKAYLENVIIIQNQKGIQEVVTINESNLNRTENNFEHNFSFGTFLVLFAASGKVT